MESRAKLRAVGVSLSALLFVLVGASAVNGAAACSVTVSPRSGAAGTLFSFHGKGFEPNQLMLHKGDADAGSHQLGNTGDPWSLTVRSRPGDEGQWSAEFTSKECSAVASFSVTLSNTDAAADARLAPAHNSMPLPAILIVLGVGAGSGLFLGRRLLGLSVDNR